MQDEAQDGEIEIPVMIVADSELAESPKPKAWRWHFKLWTVWGLVRCLLAINLATWAWMYWSNYLDMWEKYSALAARDEEENTHLVFHTDPKDWPWDVVDVVTGNHSVLSASTVVGFNYLTNSQQAAIALAVDAGFKPLRFPVTHVNVAHPIAYKTNVTVVLVRRRP